jgi:hypothetical protein
MSSTEVTRNDDVVVVVPGASDLGPSVRTRFTDSVTNYAMAVLNETSRIEFTQRGSSAIEPEYTSAQVDNAVRVVNNRGVAPRRAPRWVFNVRIVQPILTTALGVAVSQAFIDAGWWPLAGLLIGLSLTSFFLLLIHDKEPAQ